MAANKNEDDKGSRSPWMALGVMGALGFEFVGFVLVGVYIGHQIDEYFDSSPVGILLSVFLSLVAVGMHIYYVTRRFVKDGES